MARNHHLGKGASSQDFIVLLLLLLLGGGQWLFVFDKRSIHPTHLLGTYYVPGPENAKTVICAASKKHSDKGGSGH